MGVFVAVYLSEILGAYSIVTAVGTQISGGSTAGLTVGFTLFALNQDSCYVTAGRYTTVMGVYNAGAVEKGLRYVLVGVFCENESAITGWNIYGVQQTELDLDQIYLDSMSLN